MSARNLQAQWIWCGGEERPRNFYLYARKSIVLKGQPRSGSIRITADSRYRLWVNGMPVARGPARCDPRWQCLDEWDISDWLLPGENVIAVLVHHYGEWTFSYVLGRGGLLADAHIELTDGKPLHVGTDHSWRVCRADAWETALPRMNLQLGYPEVYDARKAPERWLHAGFDDTAWEPATLLGPPGVRPWENLIPRKIPAMTEIPIPALRVIDAGELGSARTGHYLDLLRVIWSPSHGVAYLATYVHAPRACDAELRAGSQDAIKLWVNGIPVISNCVTRDPAPDQESVPIRLLKGWNAVLAKIVQGEGQWHFYFRIDGTASHELLFADSPYEPPAQADPLRPWRIIGPFPSSSLQEGFERQFPPEHEMDFSRGYPGAAAEIIGWTSAGLTAEHLTPSVIMSREMRLAGRGTAIEPLSGIVVPGTPAVVRPGAEFGRYVVVDFGREVSGYPVMDIDAADGGEVLDIGYAEVLHTADGRVVLAGSHEHGLVNPDRSGVHYADRYICKQGRQQFQTFDKRAFRYLQIDVRNLRTPLRLGPVSLLLSTYPVAHAGDFECQDALLNRIWATGRWTLQLTMEDAYVDCPWRERAQWWGDARVQALVNYYAFGDHALMRQGLRHIAQSQTGDGLTRGVYPAGWPGGVLPTYTMLWVISLREYFDFTGDRDLVVELYPAVQRAIDFFGRFRTSHDLLRNLPPWLFVDWADVATSGESAAINALYYGALMSAATLAAAAGHAASAAGWSSLAARTRDGMGSNLWDEQRACFRDTRDPDSNVSEQANCLALEFGAAPDGKAAMIMDALAEDRAETIRMGTPYGGFSLLNALARAGMHDRALEYIRTRWGAMLEKGATTWWEYWDPKGSFCHGWSTGPTHFLPAEILGVKPGAPGWALVAVEPHPGGLAWARGRVMTPLGDVAAGWESGAEFSLQLTTPVPARVSLPRMRDGIVSVAANGGAPAPVDAEPTNDGLRLAISLKSGGEYLVVSR